MELAIIDYGVGNLYSLKCALQKTEVDPRIISPGKVSNKVDALILPGVGSFKSATRNLRTHMSKFKDMINSGLPTLGICLGLQLFFGVSEEGSGEGLDLLQGKIVRLPESVKVPHMGWNTLKILIYNEFVDGLREGSHVYFVHSYHPLPSRKDVVLAETEYGIRFPSIVAFKNLYGVQFHPEKSGKIGQSIINNFVKIVKR